jgi:competence protein ComEC
MDQRKSPAPLLAPVIFWCLGLVLAHTWPLPAWLSLAAGAFLVCLWLALRSSASLFPLLLCLVLGTLRFQAAQAPTNLDLAFRNQDRIRRQGEFTVLNLLSPENSLYEIRLNKLGDSRMKEKLILRSERPVEPGKAYAALLDVLPGRTDRLLDTYPARHRATVLYQLRETEQGKRLLPLAWWRQSLLRLLDRRLGPSAPFAKALLLSDLAAKTQYRDELKRGGMVHLIVVSGLHVWFIYYVSMVLLNLFLPRRGAEVAFLVLIGVFAGLNFFAPPIMRAVLMIAVFIIARWQGRKVSPQQILALSLLIVTLIDPEQLFGLGLQLSYLSVGVILFAVPRVNLFRSSGKDYNPIMRHLDRTLQYIILSAVVSVAILPLTLFHFGTATLNGVIGNLIAVPLTAVLLALSFLVVAVPLSALSASYQFFLFLFEKWMNLIARLPFYRENAHITIWQFWALILLCGSLLYLIRRRRATPWLKLAAGAGLLLLVIPPLLLPLRPGVYLFKAGTADCIMLQLDSKTTLLVDTGPKFLDNPSWASRKLLPWLRHKGVKDIDYLVLTHLDNDHSGGFADIAGGYRIRHVFVTDETVSKRQWRDWVAEGLLKGSSVTVVRDTLSLRLGRSRLLFFHPDKEYRPANDNNASLVFRLDHRSERYLFTGDIEQPAENHLLDRYPGLLRADYLKAAHHGSKSSNSLEFVTAVHPEEVWITASPDNRWGFPHREALDSFRRCGAAVRSTARGSIYVPFTQND